MELLFKDVDLNIRFISQATENLAALRMGIDIIWLNQATCNQLSHQRMIGRQLIQLFTTQHVGATIPYIENIRMLTHYQKTCDGRPHIGYVKLVLLAESRIC